jgi:uncharacterized membrane protein YeiB
MKQSPRIPGYDIARFLAVFGFVAVDMVGQVVWSDEGGGFGERPEGPTALYWLWQGWWGRASAMLAVLAGTGLALMFKEGLAPDAASRKKRAVLKRCLFLFVVGHLWNSSTLWSWSILHYYTFFLAIGLLFTRVRPRMLALSAFLFVTIAAVDNMAFAERDDWSPPEATSEAAIESADGEPVESTEKQAELSVDAAAEGAEGDGADVSASEEDAEEDNDWEGSFGDPKIWEAEFWSLRHHISTTLFDGMYPLFPWMAFLLVGMWVVRVGLDEVRRRRQILAASLATVALSFGAWWAARHFGMGELAERLTDIDRSACMPLYFLSSAGQAVALLCLSMSVTSMWPKARWIAPLVATGQMTFTIYIIRIFIGGGDREGLFDWIGFATGASNTVLVDGWIRVAVFMILAIWGCHYWVKRFERGPLEKAMRRFSGR